MWILYPEPEQRELRNAMLKASHFFTGELEANEKERDKVRAKIADAMKNRAG